MKPHTRMSSNVVCVFSRKNTPCLIFSLIAMTISYFMLIELRIFSIRYLMQKEIFEVNVLTTTNSTNGPRTHRVEAKNPSSTNLTPETWKNDMWNYDAVQALFDGNPQCSEQLHLLILVVTEPSNFERRKAIRNSWANMKRWKRKISELKFQIVFLVGKSSSRYLNKLLKDENDISADILIGEYIDSYRNLTVKVMHGFSWAQRLCQSSFILKTDDDCFVNLPLLLQFLWKYNTLSSGLYVGKIRHFSPVIRDPKSRWYVSNSEYSKSTYPIYAYGAGYILSSDVLEKLLLFSKRIPIFPNEDAYVGTVLQEAGLQATNSGRFVLNSDKWKMCNFSYLFVVHMVKPSRQVEFQDMANKAVELCSMNYTVEEWM